MTKLAENFAEFALRLNSWLDRGAYNDVNRILNDISKFKEDVIKAVNGTQQVRISTGVVPIAGSLIANIVWPVAFKDDDYTVVVIVEDASDQLEVRSIKNRLPGSVDALIVNNDGGATHTGTIHAVGIYA
jgi:hypothetical protein